MRSEAEAEGGGGAEDALPWLLLDIFQSVERGEAVGKRTSEADGSSTPLWRFCTSIYLMPLINTLGTKIGTNTMIYPMSLHKLQYLMLHFSSTLLVCMQSRHQDCRQHSCTLRLQDCDQNFFRAPIGILAEKSPGFRYRYWLRFLGRSRDQTFRAFFQASNSTHFKHPVPTLPDRIACPSLGTSKNCPR